MNALAYNPVIKKLPLGQYSLGVSTGLLAAATNGEIFQFRWADASRICAIKRVTLAVVASTPFGAAPASMPTFGLAKATAWTVQGTGGAANSGMTTGACKRRSAPLMPNSLLVAGDVRTAAAAALGAGTKTFDPEYQAQVVGNPVSAITGPVVPPTDLVTTVPSSFDYPLVFSQNEGFSILLFNNPGTGTMMASVTVEWMETNP